MASSAIDRARELMVENERLRLALAFYADIGSYENATPRQVRPVIRDQGEIARAALAREVA